MVFTKGNKLGVGGRKPGAGRPPKTSTVIRKFLDNYPNAYDECLEILYNKAILSKDRESAQYLCDRLKGRPHQSIDQRTLNVAVQITPEQYREALSEAKDYETKLLEE